VIKAEKMDLIAIVKNVSGLLLDFGKEKMWKKILRILMKAKCSNLRNALSAKK
jgi:hypothetical protein